MSSLTKFGAFLAVVVVAGCSGLSDSGPGSSIVADPIRDAATAGVVVEGIRSGADGICVQGHTESFPANTTGRPLERQSPGFRGLNRERPALRFTEPVEETTLFEVYYRNGQVRAFYEPGFRFFIAFAGVRGCYAVPEISIVRCPAARCMPTSEYVVALRD